MDTYPAHQQILMVTAIILSRRGPPLPVEEELETAWWKGFCMNNNLIHLIAEHSITI